MASEKKHLNANLCIGDLNVNIRGMEVSPDCLAPVGAGVSLARAPKWLCIWDEERRRREERSPDTAPPAPGSQLVSGSGTGPGLREADRAGWRTAQCPASVVALCPQPGLASRDLVTSGTSGGTEASVIISDHHSVIRVSSVSHQSVITRGTT